MYSGLLIKEINSLETVFINSPTTVSLIPHEASVGISGYAIGKQTIDKLYKGAVGEHLERLAIYKNNKLITHKYHSAFNFLTQEEDVIETKNLSLMLSSIHNVDKNFFSDSSGVAFHIDSKSVIENAFCEFIERQSLVYSFVTQYSGTKVNMESSQFLMQNQLILRKYFTEIKINNISILNDVFTILIVGTSDKHCGVGLGSNINFEKAFTSAMNEVLGATWHLLPHEFSQEKGELRSEWRSNPHYYAEYFESYSTKENLNNDYGYLDFGSNSTLTSLKPKNINNIVSDFSRSNELNIKLAFIDIYQFEKKFKVVKFFSEDCYPHIFNQEIQPEDYKISYIGNKNPSFPNKHKYLPFP